MTATTRTWPTWLPRVLWPRRVCPSCSSVQFKPGELRPHDGLLAMLALRPVRCMFCWRRYYWLSLRGASVSDYAPGGRRSDSYHCILPVALVRGTYLTEAQCFSGIQSPFTCETPTCWPQTSQGCRPHEVLSRLVRRSCFVASLSIPLHGAAGVCMEPHIGRVQCRTTQTSTT